MDFKMTSSDSSINESYTIDPHGHGHSLSHARSLSRPSPPIAPTAVASRHDQPAPHYGRPAQLDAQFHHRDSPTVRVEPSVGTSPAASALSCSAPAKRRRIEASSDGCVTCRARKVSKPCFLVSRLPPPICRLPPIRTSPIYCDTSDDASLMALPHLLAS